MFVDKKVFMLSTIRSIGYLVSTKSISNDSRIVEKQVLLKQGLGREEVLLPSELQH